MEVVFLQIRSVDYNFTPVKPYAKPFAELLLDKRRALLTAGCKRWEETGASNDG